MPPLPKILKRPITRRQFLRASAATAFAAASTFSYGSFIAPYNLSITQITLPIPNLPPHLTGTRLVQLSDFHAGPRVKTSLLQSALSLALELNPHYLLITGDFVDSVQSHLLDLTQLLKPITAQVPTYGSTGNHDFGRNFSTRAFADTVCSALQTVGVHMLRNDLHQPIPGPGELCFVGLEDLWSNRSDPRVLARAPADATVILLSHNPDTYDGLTQYRWHLMLSGHTHGGQVCLPFYGPLILPVEHRERASGLFHLDPAQPHRALYVNRGIGNLLRIRLFCPPEITCFTLATLTHKPTIST